jgi:hypothetical protein
MMAVDLLTNENIKGFSLIKGLFFTRFPAAAGIERLTSQSYEASRDTQEQAFKSSIIFGGYTEEQVKAGAYVPDQSEVRRHFESTLRGKTVTTGLTDAELHSLRDYTGGSFTGLNSTLREHGPAPADEGQAANKAKSMVQSELVVSGLNKLPRYQGVAFRMQNAFGDFDAAVHPGGIYADLAFMSASRTVQGAEEGGASGGATKPGALEVYMMIRSKSARMVTFTSAISRETEVLFPPGIRFKVNAIWRHVDGQVPSDAPPEAQMILLRTGEVKTKGASTGNVRVVELTEA